MSAVAAPQMDQSIEKQEENPIVLLNNRFCNKIKWYEKSTEVPPFEISKVQGKTYKGVGINKKEAKQKAAESALNQTDVSSMAAPQMRWTKP